MDDATESSPEDEPRVGWLYGGTLLWVIVSLAVGWLPLLWFNGWSPSTPLSWVLLMAFTVILSAETIGWWFLIGWRVSLTSRMRTNAVVIAALLGTVGIIAETAAQLSGPYGASLDGDPGIGYLLAIPAVPVLVALPLMIVMAVGFYVHAFRNSRLPAVTRTHE